LAVLFPSRLKVIDHDYVDRTSFRAWLIDTGFRNHFSEPNAQSHATSPFCWLATSESAEPADIKEYVGGHDDTLAWCRQFLTPKDDDKNNDMDVDDGPVNDEHTPDHGYDYDLVVIGGGSGGMAASKEAARFGAKVACCDFVKPSPMGTTWGLGGTCVNVGCIPKKLYHAASLLREAVTQDSPAFGLHVGDANAMNGDDGVAPPKTTPRWEILRENIQNHIRGLNFKYRVRLREKEVTYFNKLATFVDPHTIEVVDKKGRTSTITSSRFLIATGGRPTPLDCPGGELSISSDDVFSLEKSPGKTLCVGASYISLECAGYLHGLGLDTTVAVRSILLRGFDRQCSERIGQYMADQGVKFKYGVTPSKLEKLENGQIQVTFSDGTSDAYDTVLTAIGRQADTDKLGLDKIGVKTNPKNKRILANKFEQTDCPNVYALGDVLDGTPELTPVAIQAGLLLTRRLFDNAKQPMDYVNICTTVFTPLEYSCIGLSEDDAVAQYGEENIEVYHSEFIPLEWSMSTARGHHAAYTKVIVEKTPDQKVLGIHYVGPNAGEVMQGFGISMRKGLTYDDLVNTVGIHPTCAEEIVTLSITKSSGEAGTFFNFLSRGYKLFVLVYVYRLF
jgi:thioredoxin reductase (NADPH)